MVEAIQMSATGVKIVITIGVETSRKIDWRETAPQCGEYQTSLLLGKRLTRVMANGLAAQIKRDMMRRGFRALKGYRELRT